MKAKRWNRFCPETDRSFSLPAAVLQANRSGANNGPGRQRSAKPGHIAQLYGRIVIRFHAGQVNERSQPDRRIIDEGIRSVMHEAARESMGKPAVILDPSPNHASREQVQIQFLVLHNTDGPFVKSLAHLKDPASRVSAHYLIDRNGSIYQLVLDTRTAWHSGNKSMNQQSIGVELVASEAMRNLAPLQESALVSLARFLMTTYDLPVSNVILHRSVSTTDCPRWLWEDDPSYEEWKSARLSSRSTDGPRKVENFGIQQLDSNRKGGRPL